ncbi:aldolase [Alteribacter populi]|uniref:aldolase n=1 Tax=Alteribacter populi TaxID=2011011 RepID=UPI000BBA6ECC|nr:aldolase [Alteribacter populi]
MTDTVKITVYSAFGLNVSSEYHLPELPQSKLENHLADIIIKQSDLTAIWTELAKPNQYFVIKETLVLFQIPEMAIFSIQNGNEILVSPLQEANEDQIRLYLLGTCMGAILMQRKILPLHGSAIAIGRKAYAIVGESGAGKSTLASAFLKKGFSLISDDVIPVTLSKDGLPLVTPAYPQQKLWQESLESFGMDSKGFTPIVDRETKFAVPIPSQFEIKTLPLAGVFELVKTENHEIELTPVYKLERFHTLYRHTYRNFIVSKSGLMEWHFNTSVNIANKIELFRLERPVTRFTAHDLSSLILSTITRGRTYDSETIDFS